MLYCSTGSQKHPRFWFSHRQRHKPHHVTRRVCQMAIQTALKNRLHQSLHRRLKVSQDNMVTHIWCSRCVQHIPLQDFRTHQHRCGRKCHCASRRRCMTPLFTKLAAHSDTTCVRQCWNCDKWWPLDRFSTRGSICPICTCLVKRIRELKCRSRCGCCHLVQPYYHFKLRTEWSIPTTCQFCAVYCAQRRSGKPCMWRTMFRRQKQIPQNDVVFGRFAYQTLLATGETCNYCGKGYHNHPST